VTVFKLPPLERKWNQSLNFGPLTKCIREPEVVSGSDLSSGLSSLNV